MIPAPHHPMLGHLLVQVVFVDGPPGSSAAFSAGEKVAILPEVYLATGLLRRIADGWGRAQATPNLSVCGFTVATTTVTLSRDPATVAGVANDPLWLTDALALLGASSEEELSRHLTRAYTALGVGDTALMMVTKYPCFHHAYAQWPTAVVNWTMLQATNNADIPDRVIAHELGHVFGATDEYRNSTRTCHITEVRGPFTEENHNCEVLDGGAPNPKSTACLMRRDSPVACPSTHLHWGWKDADGDGLPDLSAPATITALSHHHPSSPSGAVLGITGRNVWDARVIAFGDTDLSDRFDFRGFDSIDVLLPASMSAGVSTVSVLTRSGWSSGDFENTWFFTPPTGVSIPGSGPVVFATVDPSGGPGDQVWLLGARLDDVFSVTFGGVSADLTGATVAADGSHIVLTAPAGPTGLVDVVATSPSGTSVPIPGFSDFKYL